MRESSATGRGGGGGKSEEEGGGGGRRKEGREKDRRREKGEGRREGRSSSNALFIRFREHRSSETFLFKGSVSPDPDFHKVKC